LHILTNRANIASHRVIEGRRNSIVRSKLNKEIEILEDQLAKTKKSKKFTEDTIKIITEYLNEKKANAMSDIYKGIDYAKSIVPVAQNIFLKIDGEKANFVTEDGLLVDDQEGSAYRALLHIFCKSAILENTSFMSDLLIDEGLSTASPETSELFAKYLPILAQRRLIVLVEQKREIFMECDKMYLVEKIDNRSIVKEVSKC